MTSTPIPEDNCIECPDFVPGARLTIQDDERYEGLILISIDPYEAKGRPRMFTDCTLVWLADRDPSELPFQILSLAPTFVRLRCADYQLASAIAFVTKLAAVSVPYDAREQDHQRMAA